MKPKPKSKTLIIERERWLVPNTGENEDSCLYDSSTKRMCCLGFVARKLMRQPCNIIADCAGPMDTNELNWIPGLKPVPHKYFSTYSETPIATKLMDANDSQRITFADREKRIKGLFAKIGISVKFTGKYLARVE